jgi:osmotically-inducible protein OsmY
MAYQEQQAETKRTTLKAQVERAVRNVKGVKAVDKQITVG